MYWNLTEIVVMYDFWNGVRKKKKKFGCFFGEVMGCDIWFHFLNMNDCMET